MKCTALISRENSIELVSGKTKVRELGKTVFQPFEHDEIKSVKVQQGFSEALLKDDVVEEVEVEEIIEWKNEQEAHVMVREHTGSTYIMASSEYVQHKQSISELEDGLVLLYGPISRTRASVDIIPDDGSWDVDVCTSGNITEISAREKHIRFASENGVEDGSIVTEL